ADFFNAHYGMSMRYVGVGGMLCAAVLTLLRLLKPLYQNLAHTLGNLHLTQNLPLHEQDLSQKTIRFGLIACFLLLALLLNHLFVLTPTGVMASLLFILLIGFVVAIVAGYFSGLVGVSASPGSSILIAVLILTGLLVHLILGLKSNATTNLMGEAMTIIIASVMMQIACIANDTMQDLKVGQVIGASPRKQQVMLIFGALIASLIVPAVMQVLYAAYGIAGHMPRPLMNPADSLAAPPAAIIAALTGTIFKGAIPLKLLALGAGVVLIVAAIQALILKRFKIEFSLIAIGIGMYLPLSSSTPLIIGAVLSLCGLKNAKVLLACGLVTGASLMDVILAVPIALNPQGQALQFLVGSPVSLSLMGLGVIALLWAFVFS
ncbi:MAG: oligopeptide transporter, OPT family, partial [Gammaproteobacteria bacterium]|nr:oligopeptide transporter, OPT family [Gammaproteobacteria bacterium]